jgi:hypothetical protein
VLAPHVGDVVVVCFALLIAIDHSPGSSSALLSVKIVRRHWQVGAGAVWHGVVVSVALLPVH